MDIIFEGWSMSVFQAISTRIATKVALGAYAIILLDQAGWHGAKALVVPNNISLVPLPPRAPELQRNWDIPLL